jgi:16S rRNA (uracil1498-N3)-methyltransferase
MPKQTFASQVKTQTETVILIGPEGDFRQDEVELAIENGYKTVSLGQQRLRTETAAISACSFFNLLNDEGM